MTRYRNVSDLPLDDFPGGRQLFAQGETDLSDAEAAAPEVAIHIEQRNLVAVTLATVPAAPLIKAPPAALDESS